jgi:hypothetical protein
MNYTQFDTEEDAEFAVIELGNEGFYAYWKLLSDGFYRVYWS